MTAYGALNEKADVDQSKELTDYHDLLFWLVHIDEV